jgi:hypothetical protein
MLAALKNLPHRKGMLMQLALVPNETIMTKYGREGGLMTTQWMRVDTEEREFLVSRARSMMEAMVRNGWGIVSTKLSFVYDRVVAKKDFFED